MDAVEVVVKWSGKEYIIKGLVVSDTISQLKYLISQETGVLPERQKLLGLKLNGKPPSDEVKLSELSLKSGTKIMMMGTREEILADVIEPPPVTSEVVNDFDIEDDEIAIHNREEYLAKIDRRIKTYEFKTINEPRPGKKLLVLDVDYTLFAATSMKWIDAKMQELGVSGNTVYKLCMMMDDLAMITVDTPTYGVIQVKPLGVIWGRFPQWSQTNTIMVDDLRRNFIMNPQNGLKIRPFKNAHMNRETDRELVHLAEYLKHIAQLEDFSTLNHRHWEKYKGNKSHGKRRRHHHPHCDGPSPDSSSNN
jgi:ubiquitin-like domain-containing CTD phosphatase 1